jgi:hypothetical protein
LYLICFFSYPFVFKQLYGISSQYEIDKFIYITNKEFEENEIKGNYKLENGFKLYYEYIKCYGIAYIPDKNSKLFKMDDSNSISYSDFSDLNLCVPVSCFSIMQNAKYLKNDVDSVSLAFALYYLKKGAALHDYNSMCELSELYKRGEVVEKNLTKSRKLASECDSILSKE